MSTTELLLDGPFDGRQLRQALGRFATGVTVITTCGADGKREGLTANSFSALSLDPPLVLWSIVRKSASLPGFLAAGRFAINVLDADQAALSHRFATPHPDKFDGVSVETGQLGCPILTGALASFECRTEQTHEGGDHVLFVGRVGRVRYRDGHPLVFSAGRYCSAVPMPVGTAASDLDSVWGGLG